MKNITKIMLVGVLGLTAMLGNASAQTVMLDFGPSTIDTGKANVAPYKPATGENSWTRVFTTQWDTAQSVDTVTVGSLTLNMGLGNTSTVDFNGSKALRSSPLSNGGSPIKDLFVANSPVSDAIFSGDSTAAGGSNDAIGIQIRGLVAGSYEIYITGQNTNGGGSGTFLQQNFYLSTSAQWQGGGLTYTTWDSQVVKNTNLTWTLGDNYAKFSFDIGASDVLSLVAIGNTGGEKRGFLNSLQIVQISQIPEPSAWALMLTGAAMLFALARKPRGAKNPA